LVEKNSVASGVTPRALAVPPTLTVAGVPPDVLRTLTVCEVWLRT
jgi:hypothetical protein